MTYTNNIDVIDENTHYTATFLEDLVSSLNEGNSKVFNVTGVAGDMYFDFYFIMSNNVIVRYFYKYTKEDMYNNTTGEHFIELNGNIFEISPIYYEMYEQISEISRLHL